MRNRTRRPRRRISRKKQRQIQQWALLGLAAILVLGIALGVSQCRKKEKARLSGTLTVCLDAGHGGKDFGTSKEGRKEKDDNLALALLVEKELKDQGADVVMTRTKDEAVSLQERCRIANDAKADYFVALHRNSAEKASGVEIWVSKKRPTEDTALAENILSALEEVGIQANRGVRFGYQGDANGEYYVNRNTNMPSCLVETGFITNKKDNTLLDKHKKEYARAIAGAIIKTGRQAVSNSK